MALLTLESAGYTYPLAAQPALSDASLRIEEGTLTLLCGATGSGKSTLLRMMKKGLCDAGERSGAVYYDGAPLDQLADLRAVCEIGFVFQDANAQIVMDTVWHELAFSLENLALSQHAMRARIAEMAAFFGLEPLMEKPVETLSGGEKKRLCLASVMILRPRVLLLDEPISALDPVAARDVADMIGRIVRELGTTVLIAEHHMAECLPFADAMVYLKDGRVQASGAVDAVCAEIARQERALLPELCALYFKAPSGAMPRDVAAARRYLQGRDFSVSPRAVTAPGERVFALREVDFFYPGAALATLRGVSLTARAGESIALLGGNGAGKSTLLKLMARILAPTHGTAALLGKKLRHWGRAALYEHVAYLAQDPRLYFTRDSVAEELSATGAPPEDIAALSARFSLTALADARPEELSGGQQELLALALVLLPPSKILLLDEPTAGLDAAARQALCALLEERRRAGALILFATHDMEFAARAATRCAMLFQGALSADAPVRDFFAGQYFYTTPLRRALRERAPEALCAEELIPCGG